MGLTDSLLSSSSHESEPACEQSHHACQGQKKTKGGRGGGESAGSLTVQACFIHFKRFLPGEEGAHPLHNTPAQDRRKRGFTLQWICTVYEVIWPAGFINSTSVKSPFQKQMSALIRSWYIPRLPGQEKTSLQTPPWAEDSIWNWDTSVLDKDLSK